MACDHMSVTWLIWHSVIHYMVIWCCGLLDTANSPLTFVGHDFSRGKNVAHPVLYLGLDYTSLVILRVSMTYCVCFYLSKYSPTD